MIVHAQTPREFKELVETRSAVVADFWATWCGPCVMMGKTLESVDEELGESLTVVKVDVDNVDIQALGEDFPFVKRIRSIPTLAFFKNGELVDVDLDGREESDDDDDDYNVDDVNDEDNGHGIFIGAVSKEIFLALLARAGLT